MNAFILMLPFFLVRLVLLPVLSREASQRAAEFAPVYGGERFAYTIYQLSNVAIFIYPFFMRVEFDFSWQFWVGAVCYLLGLALCTASVIAFAHPDGNGLNTNGVYRFSRHPMYVSYFFCFIGVAAMAKSPMLLALVIMFQISAHWIILSEERWCLNRFGEAYEEYMKKVRRYF